jgi:ribonuclease HI
MKLLQFDGASRGNPGFGSSAAVLSDQGKQINVCYKRLPGKVTNNQAEYMGLLSGLKMALHLGITELQVEGDSKLVIEHLFGSWECKHPRIVPYYQEARKLLKRFNFINGRWIPREQNKDADSYCNLALDRNVSGGLHEWFQAPIKQNDKKDIRNYFTVNPVDK